RNTLLWCSQRFLVILACFQKGSKQSRMGLSIYLSYNGGLRPPVAGRMLSANRPVRASYHLYIMFPVSFPRWRQTPSITARRAVTHRGWHHSQPRGPSMSLHNLPCKLCSNDGSCVGMHAVLPPLTPTPLTKDGHLSSLGNNVDDLGIDDPGVNDPGIDDPGVN